MSIITQYQGSTSMKELAKWVTLPRSSYYYKPGNNRKGIPPSTTTKKRDGTEVSNNEVVEDQENSKWRICMLWLSECNIGT